MSTSAAGDGPESANRILGDGIVIAIDGPSASGKSSASRGVARALGLRYLDTGSMYRALTWWMLAREIPVEDATAVAAATGEPIIEVGTDPDGPWVTVDGQDVSAAIRIQEVTGAVSAVARVPQVRARLIADQRDIIGQAQAGSRGIVAEGRDIGTVVAPDAVVKVYLTASEQARAQRRTAESAAGNPAATVGAGQIRATQADQARRDRADSGQLARADDAVEIDSTMFSLDDVISMIAKLAQERAGLPDPAQTTR